MGQGQTNTNLEKSFHNIINEFSDKDREQLETLKKELTNEQIFILIKILKSDVLRKKVKSKIREACYVFSDEEQIKQIYLNTSWKTSLKNFHDAFPQDEEEESLETEGRKSNPKSKMLSSKSESSNSSFNLKKLEEDEEEGTKFDVQLKDVKIKLIISETSQNFVGKTVRHTFSPFLSKLDVLPEFGMFHSGLMIGPWMIDWNDSGICIPRKCSSQAAIFAVDLETISTESKLEDVVDVIAAVIAEWNCTKLYTDKPNEKANEGNCQEFVMDILHRLKIEFDFKGPIKEYLTKQIRTKGQSSIKFRPEKEFLEKFTIKSKEVEFKTHEDLDKFVIDLLKTDDGFKEHYPDHYGLLKAFDRAFWLRHIKYPENNKYPPKKHDKHEEDCGCPFKDPHDTGTIIIQQ